MGMKGGVPPKRSEVEEIARTQMFYVVHYGTLRQTCLTAELLAHRFLGPCWDLFGFANSYNLTKPYLVGGFKHFFIFTPTWGNDPI